MIDLAPDLYHRALTGRGDPITSDDVIQLIEDAEDQLEDCEKEAEEASETISELNSRIVDLETEAAEAKQALARETLPERVFTINRRSKRVTFTGACP